ncbi:MAG TPA: hypothetical protein VFS43_26820, partial [Polyangiaceae bacterium]|nr:hypothetical protein [Polyangiaceae bacterium]
AATAGQAAPAPTALAGPAAVPPAGPAAAPPAGPALDAAPTAAGALTPEASAQARLAALEARLKALEAASERASKAAPAATSPSPFRLFSYVQAQYERHQDSEDQVQQGGSPLNQDRFLVRRARLRLDGSWQYAALSFELDGNTTRAPAVSVRRAEATLLARAPGGGAPPYAALTAGISEVPFGREMTERANDRVFMERTTASLAFFPGEPDVGVRVWGGASAFRYAVALLNGEPLDERTARPPREWNAAKDVVSRLGVDLSPAPGWRVAAGTSFLRGRGFHPGAEATKDAAQWRDLNENSTIDQGEVSAVPGTAATPSLNFSRWALGADLLVAHQTRLGLTTASGEVTAASNLDRGLYVADPIVTGLDQRALGYHVALVQELGRFALAGFRSDFYDPNADFLLERAGKLVPATQHLRTYSPLVGLVLPERARLVFQYDFVRDNLARDARGVPTDLRNDRWTLRLQVQL